MLLDCKTVLITNYFFATCLFLIWVVWVVSLMQRMMFVFSFFCLRERGCHNHSKLGPLLDFLLDCITSQECQHILFLLYFSLAQLENAKEWNNKSHTNWLWRFPFFWKKYETCFLFRTVCTQIVFLEPYIEPRKVKAFKRSQLMWNVFHWKLWPIIV